LETSQNDAAVAEASAAGRLARLQGRLLAWRAALTRRFKRSPGAGDAAAAETAPTRSERAPPQAGAGDGGTTETRTPRWRRLAISAAAVLLCVSAGAGLAYLGLSRQLAARAAELAHQASEIARQEVEIVQRDDSLAAKSKEIEQQKETLKAAEAQVSRLAAAATAAAAVPPADAPVSVAARVELPAAAPLPMRRPAADVSTGGSAGAGDCTVKPGSVATTLKRCIDDFNRVSR